jgi:hypothetical protein
MSILVLIYMMNVSALNILELSLFFDHTSPCQYLDRNNIAAARLSGLEADLKLQGNQYQTVLSILYVGPYKGSEFLYCRCLLF